MPLVPRTSMATPSGVANQLHRPGASCGRLPNSTIAAGMVVTAPTTSKVAPTAFRAAALNLSERRSATPAPSTARVPIIKPSSGIVRVLVCIVEHLAGAELVDRVQDR